MTHLAAPNPGNYTIGAHKILVGAAGPGQIDLGNVVSANVNVTLEELTHFSAQSGEDVEDANIIRRTQFNIEATIDEPNKENVMKWFMADPANGYVGMLPSAITPITFQGIAIYGNEFTWAIVKAVVRPNGSFGYNKDDWTTLGLTIKLIFDKDNPTHPWGVLTHNGVS